MTFKFKDIGGVPSNPPAGYVGLYCNGGVLYWIDESGTTTSIASGTGDLLANGSVPLTANWDVGAFKITALQLESDVATGTAPLIVASETLVTNLNADKIDGADLIDEDDMVSDSDTAVPTQQSVKAYADGKVAKATFDANTILKADSDDTPAALTVGEQTLVGRITAGSITALTATQVRTLLNVEDGATADQTGAEIKAAYEAEADTNALTDARAAAVDAAIVDGDFSGSDGFMRKTGAGTYEVVKANMAATAAPTVDNDVDEGYAVGSRWIDVTNDKEYVCLDATDGAAVWTETTGAGGGGADADAIHDNVAGEIAAVTEKTRAASADLLLIEDSEASNAKKRTTIRNVLKESGAVTLRFTLSDDSVWSYNFGADMFVGHVIISHNSGAETVYGILAIRAAASSAFCISMAKGAQLNVATGVLAGTTGSDGVVTVSTHTDNKIYVENRMGGSRAFVMTISAPLTDA